MNNYTKKYYYHNANKNVKNRVASLLTLFLLSTTFNHEIFFIEIGNFSLRPYMLVIFFGITFMISSKIRIYVTKEQLSIILLVFLFFIFAFSTSLVSPYLDDSPFMFLRNAILLFIQFLTVVFMCVIFNHINDSEAFNAIITTLKFILVVALLLYIYHIASKGLINYSKSYLGVLYSYQGRPRLMGTVGDPNYFSLYITIYYWLYLFFSRKLAIKANNLISALFVISILLTQSRTAIIINTLAILILAFKELHFKPKSLFPTLIYIEY